ncbi:hypothetical protein B0O99DRAFT_34298 [Bisporella sp. PMI_857]|nr:hypothetical protein B0O99DRAFT_34298 [Bisporella sp. PMI_857]
MPISEPILATSADGPAIALLHRRSTEETGLSHLVLAHADPSEWAAYSSASIALSVSRKFNRYLVVKDTETGEIISYANWVVPHSEAEAEEEEREFGEKVMRLREEGQLPARPGGINMELDQIFQAEIARLRSVLGEGEARRRVFLCDNLATDPKHRRRGAASKLMRWPFEQADREGLACYLDTDPHGPAISLYERLGFVAVSERLEIDLTKYGGKGIHYHVGMIREPVGKESGPT